MASRYTGSRYDGDSRRSRSRDRSPDRRSLYSDGGPRRSSAESRSNTAAFQTNRDSFRDTLPRDTPRGPKALLDPPSGPRGGGYSGDFRGRGRGRGRGWRDDSRDRGRDRDIDFRDRRDTAYRDDRSRERERPDWRDRDRDSFRGRRPSPRGRSPLGRDFRDSRDPRDGPLGVDADRARRGSRDGPLSAGSSSSDPPFAHSSYRGGGYGRGRGRGRGGEWDRGGRGRPFYDDRDRYGGPFRSRSQEGRFRDRDDRERDNRYPEADLRSRDDRDTRDRETRLKLERTSHEPPTSTKDVSPPPIAPAAPSFGSVPNRTPLTGEMGLATGKAPPTGPRALKEDRPAPIIAPSIGDTRAPPTGPSKPSFMERSPPIPSGPRSQRPGPSSKQWINPNLKHRLPESPKLGRSLSFAQSRPAGFRPDGVPSDHFGDSHQRPRSSDAKADSQFIKADGQLRDLHITDSGEVSRIELRPQSAGSSSEQDKHKDESSSVKVDADATEEPGEIRVAENTTTRPAESSQVTVNRRPTLRIPVIRVSLPEKQRKQPALDQSLESDDEDIGDIIETQMIDVEKELKQLEAVEDSVSTDAILRYALISLEALNQIAVEPEGLEDMVGPIPETATVPEKTPAKPDPQAEEHPTVSDIPAHNEAEQPPKEDAVPVPASIELAEPSKGTPEHPQPSIEQDADTPTTQKAPISDERPGSDDGDVAMEDAVTGHAISEVRPSPEETVPTFQEEPVLPSYEEAQIDSRNASKRESSTPSPPEDEDETDIEDVDLHSIEIVQEHMRTPSLDSLPFFDEKAWDKDKAFIKSMNTPNPDLDTFILQRLKDETWSQRIVETQMRQVYSGNYDRYIRFTMSDDPVAVKSREKFTYVPGASETSHKPGLTLEPKPESTRRSRYASERDLERVLEESRRVEDEKRERQLQAEREKYRTDKEAVIPRQYQTDKERESEFYSSNTGFVRAEKIVAAWEVLPPVDNFTEEESGVFEKAYLEFPKQWGRVSEPLANRDFGTTIQFYYLKKEKEELNLKEKLKKQPKKRKRGGRGKMRSSALVSELRTDNDNEETQETGENGYTRRPRRAAAPTFNSEATPATDGEGGTPAGTPGRRGAAARADGTTEKPKRGRRPAKDKEPKPPRVAVTLAAAPSPVPTPSASTKGNRSRSTSRVQGSDWIGQPAQDEIPRLPPQYELAPNLGQSAPGIPMQSYPQTQPLHSPERGGPPASMADVMAPPPLRPEPPAQPAVAVLDIGQPTPSDRKSAGQPSSYWSVPEATEFPSLLRSFGTDWAAIAGHMRTKTAVMVKNYYTRRKDSNDWEAIVKEADDRRNRGEKRPPPPTLTATVKKRYDTSSNRPLAAADAIMEDVPTSKMEHPPPTSQSMSGRFNVPIAAQPQPPVAQSPFVQTTQAPPLVPSHHISQVGPQPLSQPTTQTMSPGSRPLRAPLPFPDREREPFLQQPSRTPLVSKPPHAPPPSVSEASMRHPLPGSMVDPQAERQKPEPKSSKEPVRQQERQQMRVKQEPDLAPQHDFYGGPPAAIRVPPSRTDSNVPLSSRPVEGPRGPAQAPQAPYAVLQHQPGRGFREPTPSSPVPPRPLSTLSRPLSRASGAEPYNAPPAQRTPPSVTPVPPRPKTSNLMALLNDDPPAPPKRVAEVPTVPKSSSTPPPHANLSRPPPPPPPPPSHIRHNSSIPEAQPYGYGHPRNPPPAPPSMSSLKPYSASPQAQPLSVPRHMPLEREAERDYYGGRPRTFPPASANSPQNTPHYQPPTQPPQVQYQPQTSYPYGAPIQPQPPNASSPPPQYVPHQPAPRSHEPPSSGRESGWPGPNSGHPLQQQHPQQQHPQQHPQQQHQQQQLQQQQQQQPAWSSHPPQPPKSTQPQPTQSAWAAQHAPPKPPQPSGSVPPQSSWSSGPPRGHDPMALRDIYPPQRMQPPLQGSYPPSSRAPEPPLPQGPAPYPRYTNTPVPGRDPRDPGPPRSYTPVNYNDRVYPPQGQDLRDAQFREQQQQQQQQQSVLQQQLRPQDRPQDRQFYDRPPPDRYGR